MWIFFVLKKASTSISISVDSQSGRNNSQSDLELIRSNKKLCQFYSIFQTDVSKSHYLEQVKNLKHKRAVAKLRSGNHSQNWIWTTLCTQVECLRICQRYRSKQTENENRFLCHRDRYKTIGQPSPPSRHCCKRAMTTSSRYTALNWGKGNGLINFLDRCCKSGKVC